MNISDIKWLKIADDMYATDFGLAIAIGDTEVLLNLWGKVKFIWRYGRSKRYVMETLTDYLNKHRDEIEYHIRYESNMPEVGYYRFEDIMARLWTT